MNFIKKDIKENNNEDDYKTSFLFEAFWLVDS